MKVKYLALVAGAAAAIAGFQAPTAQAATTLSAASCFPKGTFFSRRFEAFIKEVNEKMKGELQLRYVGGAPAIGSPFTLVQKMARGAFDVVSCTGAYYQNVLPEGDALKLVEYTPAEMRANGGYAFIDELHAGKNMKYLARIHSGMPFHLYLNKKIDKPDLKGLHLRVAPIYRNFFQSLGATTQRSNIAQVYTYMENGTVQGFGWPVTGLLPDWHKVTKFRVDPGFYDADIQILINLKKWDALPPIVRTKLTEIAIKYENEGNKADKAATVAAMKKQAEQGIVAIVFTDANREAWLKAAYEAGWAGVMKVSPKNGPKLKKLLTKQ